MHILFRLRNCLAFSRNVQAIWIHRLDVSSTRNVAKNFIAKHIFFVSFNLVLLVERWTSFFYLILTKLTKPVENFKPGSLSSFFSEVGS